MPEPCQSLTTPWGPLLPVSVLPFWQDSIIESAISAGNRGRFGHFGGKVGSGSLTSDQSAYRIRISTARDGAAAAKYPWTPSPSMPNPGQGSGSGKLLV